MVDAVYAVLIAQPIFATLVSLVLFRWLYNYKSGALFLFLAKFMVGLFAYSAGLSGSKANEPHFFSFLDTTARKSNLAAAFGISFAAVFVNWHFRKGESSDA